MLTTVFCHTSGISWVHLTVPAGYCALQQGLQNTFEPWPALVLLFSFWPLSLWKVQQTQQTSKNWNYMTDLLEYPILFHSIPTKVLEHAVPLSTQNIFSFLFTCWLVCEVVEHAVHCSPFIVISCGCNPRFHSEENNSRNISNIK